jgi:hypothetical protein
MSFILVCQGHLKYGINAANIRNGGEDHLNVLVNFIHAIGRRRRKIRIPSGGEKVSASHVFIFVCNVMQMILSLYGNSCMRFQNYIPMTFLFCSLNFPFYYKFRHDLNTLSLNTLKVIGELIKQKYVLCSKGKRGLFNLFPILI